MLVVAKPLGLEKKYGTKIELVSMPWEDQVNAIASAGQTVDVGFVGLADYLNKIERLNTQENDPIVYLFPAHLFLGGGFISLNPAVPVIDEKNIKDKQLLKKFLSFKIGAQKTSFFQLMIYRLAHLAGIDPKKINMIDTTLTDGLLAAENGSLDMAAAGIPQATEALKRGGRIVLTTKTAGIGEINGFACKESTYKKRKKDIDNLIKMWFDCTSYVLSDPDHHSAPVLDYLKKNASTQYTVAEFKKALSQEYFPKNAQEAQHELVENTHSYSLPNEASVVADYLVANDYAKIRPLPPKCIKLEQ